ncbi:hypothetical protein T261_4897 [Streptomyces lydicus]|nr:hypothetical protein T261_4897 [Streptomyces lydicus]
MVVTTEQDYVAAAATADRLVGEWLSDKGYDVTALDEGRNDLVAGVTLDRDADSNRYGTHTRWRLRERSDHFKGVWQSTLVIRGDASDPDRTWVQLDVEHQPDSPETAPSRASKPRLAEALLDALETRDGLAEIRSRAAHIYPADVTEVLEELCDEERRLPIAVASVPHNADVETWTRKVVDKAFSQLVGRSVLYILTNEARAAFNRALEYHPVFGGGIRTYLPGVDPAWPADAQRHPVMSRATVEANPARAANILSALPRHEAARRPLPEALMRVPVQRTRPRQQERLTELARLRADNEALDQLLNEAAQTEATTSKQIRDLQSELTDANWLAQEFHAELRSTQQKVRTLQSRLVQAGAYEDAYAPVEEVDSAGPGSFTELLARMGEFPTLRFTGEPKVTKSLDDKFKPNWLAICWDALLALEDFAAASAAGSTKSDFRSWCQNLPSNGHPFPVGKVKMKESDAVWRNLSWRSERMLPVPVEVDSSRFIYMEAHLRIGGGNMVSPRLHFYDDTGKSRRLYVGYIGPHLTNTQSS